MKNLNSKGDHDKQTKSYLLQNSIVTIGVYFLNMNVNMDESLINLVYIHTGLPECIARVIYIYEWDFFCTKTDVCLEFSFITIKGKHGQTYYIPKVVNSESRISIYELY